MWTISKCLCCCTLTLSTSPDTKSSWTQMRVCMEVTDAWTTTRSSSLWPSLSTAVPTPCRWIFQLQTFFSIKDHIQLNGSESVLQPQVQGHYSRVHLWALNTVSPHTSGTIFHSVGGCWTFTKKKKNRQNKGCSKLPVCKLNDFWEHCWQVLLSHSPTVCVWTVSAAHSWTTSEGAVGGDETAVTDSLWPKPWRSYISCLKKTRRISLSYYMVWAVCIYTVVTLHTRTSAILVIQYITYILYTYN